MYNKKKYLDTIKKLQTLVSNNSNIVIVATHDTNLIGNLDVN